MRRVYAQEDVCVACRLCEIACIVEHSQSKDIITAMRHENPRPEACNRVQEDGAVSLSLQCRHCSTPMCVASCLTQALSKGEDGIVHYDPDYCMACWTCVLACPYGAVRKVTRGDWKGIVKCDLCQHLEVPACVAICPNDALVFAEQREVDAAEAQEEATEPVIGGSRV